MVGQNPNSTHLKKKYYFNPFPGNWGHHSASNVVVAGAATYG